MGWISSGTSEKESKLNETKKIILKILKSKSLNSKYDRYRLDASFYGTI